MASGTGRTLRTRIWCCLCRRRQHYGNYGNYGKYGGRGRGGLRQPRDWSNTKCNKCDQLGHPHYNCQWSHQLSSCCCDSTAPKPKSLASVYRIRVEVRVREDRLGAEGHLELPATGLLLLYESIIPARILLAVS